MLEVRRGAERFRTRAEGRTTWHSFSFGGHYDAANLGFGSLEALNDERLPGGTGYPDHPHEDLEIVSWVRSGTLRHRSTVGDGVVGPGQVQRLSAGSGVVHSETADAGPVSFLQAWVRPDQPGGAPDYRLAEVPALPGWTCVADGAGRGVVPIATRGASLWVGSLDPGRPLELPEAPQLLLFVSAGAVTLAERTLHADDAARMRDEGGRAVAAAGGPAELLVWAFAV